MNEATLQKMGVGVGKKDGPNTKSTIAAVKKEKNEKGKKISVPGNVARERERRHSALAGGGEGRQHRFVGTEGGAYGKRQK